MKKNFKLFAIVIATGITTMVSCVKESTCTLEEKKIVDECHDTTLIRKDTTHKGMCMYPDPVCGCDGVTYINKDVAVNDYGLLHYTPGACEKENYDCIDSSLIPTDPADKFIPQYYAPVCGCNNVTYSNPEEASINGVVKYTKGTCAEKEKKDEFTECIDSTLIPTENVYIPMYYLPVCGCDNVTYSNSVDAEVHGVVKYTSGACGKTRTKRFYSMGL